MEFKTAYLYNDVTNEYEHETIAQKNPEADGFILPAFSTFVQPPAPQIGYARVWGEQAWSQVEDHRGQTIWHDWRTCRIVDELGPIPQGWSLTRPEKPVTKQDLCEFLYRNKCAIAYSEIIVVKENNEYLFETGQDSITMCNSEKLEFLTDETKTSTDWKVYSEGFPVLLHLTKNQFIQILSFAKEVINTAFGIEGEFNKQIQEMTDEELEDKEFINNFKTTVTAAFDEVERRFEITANME